MVGTFGEVLVMDWGIAVDIGDKNKPDQRAQHKSTIKGPSGTPSYMAPELAEGRGNDIGPWTDVYLLGAILHEILTGSPPHTGNNLMAVLLAASKSEPASYQSDVPTGLQAICHRAMAKNISERFENVEQFRTAIEDYLQHRESMLITDKASSEFNSIPKQVSQEQRNVVYANYAKVVSRFEQALELWANNNTAATGARKAREAYAHLALTSGDLGLAEAQAAPLPDDEDAKDLRNEIITALQKRKKATAAAKRNRIALAAAVLLIIIGLGVGITLVSNEKNKTEEQRDKAKTAEVAAKEQEQRALIVLEQAQADEAFSALEQGKHSKALQTMWKAIQTEKALPEVTSRTLTQFQLAKLGAHTKLAEWQSPKPQFNQKLFPKANDKHLIGQPSATFIGAAPSPDGTEVVGVWWWTQARQHRSDYHYGSQLITWSVKDKKVRSTMVSKDKIRSPLWIGEQLVCLAFQYNLDNTSHPIGVDLICYDTKEFKQKWIRNINSELHVQVWLSRTQSGTVVVNGIATEIEVDPFNGLTLNRRILTDQLRNEKNEEIYYDSITASYDMTWHKGEPFIRGNWVPHSNLITIQDNIQPGSFFNYGRPSFATGNFSSTLKTWGPYSNSFTTKEGEQIKQFIVCEDAIHIIILTNGPTGNRLLRYNAASNRITSVLDEQVVGSVKILDVDFSGRYVLTYNTTGNIRIYGQSPAKTLTTPWPSHLDNSTPLHFDIDTNMVICKRVDDSVVAIKVPEMNIIWELPADVTGNKRCIGSSVDGSALVFQKIPKDFAPLAEPGISLYHISDGRHWLDINPPQEKVKADNKFEGMGWMTTHKKVFFHKGSNKFVIYNIDDTPWGIYDVAKHQWMNTEISKKLPIGYNAATGYVSINLISAPHGLICQEFGFHSGGLNGESQTNVSWHLNLDKMSIERLPIYISDSIHIGSRMLIGNSGGLSHWDITEKAQLRYFDLSHGTPRTLTPDSRYALTENEDSRELYVLDLSRGIPLATFPYNRDADLKKAKSYQDSGQNKKNLTKNTKPTLSTKQSYRIQGRSNITKLQKPFTWQLHSKLQSIARVTPMGFTQIQLIDPNQTIDLSHDGPPAISKNTLHTPERLINSSKIAEAFRTFSKIKNSFKTSTPSQLREPMAGSPAWRVHYITQTLSSIPESIRHLAPKNESLRKRLEQWSKEQPNNDKFHTANHLFLSRTINDKGERVAKDGSTWYWVPPGIYKLDQFKNGENCEITLSQGFFIRGKALSPDDPETTLPKTDRTNPHWDYFLKVKTESNKKDLLRFQRAAFAGLSNLTSVMRLPTSAELSIAMQLHGGEQSPWYDKHRSCTTLDYWPIQPGSFTNPYGDRGSVKWSHLDDKIFITIDRCKGNTVLGAARFSVKNGQITASTFPSTGEKIFPIISGF